MRCHTAFLVSSSIGGIATEIDIYTVAECGVLLGPHDT